MNRCLTMLLIFILPSAILAAADEEAMVQRAFQAYRTALLNQNGKAAWNKVDSKTKEYYADIAKGCLSINRRDLDRIDLLTKFTILRLRLEYRENQLKGFDGSIVFIRSVEKGWISKSTVQRLKQMDKIRIDQGLAQGFIK